MCFVNRLSGDKNPCRRRQRCFRICRGHNVKRAWYTHCIYEKSRKIVSKIPVGLCLSKLPVLILRFMLTWFFCPNYTRKSQRPESIRTNLCLIWAILVYLETLSGVMLPKQPNTSRKRVRTSQRYGSMPYSWWSRYSPKSAKENLLLASIYRIPAWGLFCLMFTRIPSERTLWELLNCSLIDLKTTFRKMSCHCMIHVVTSWSNGLDTGGASRIQEHSPFDPERDFFAVLIFMFICPKNVSGRKIWP